MARKAAGRFTQAHAPLLVAYRKQRDDGTVAVPDWTFWNFPQVSH